MQNVFSKALKNLPRPVWYALGLAAALAAALGFMYYWRVVYYLDNRGVPALPLYGAAAVFVLAAALAVVLAWTGARLTKRRKTLLLGAAAGLGALLAGGLLLVALLRGQGFARLFAGAHELLFSNDLWLMNPETDVLIRMMPQTLFERAAAQAALGALRLFAAVGVLLIAIEGLVGGMIRRHLAEEDKV